MFSCHGHEHKSFCWSIFHVYKPSAESTMGNHTVIIFIRQKADQQTEIDSLENMTNMNIEVICALRYRVVSPIPLFASKCLFWKEFANYSWPLWRHMKPLYLLRFVWKMPRAYSKRRQYHLCLHLRFILAFPTTENGSFEIPWETISVYFWLVDWLTGWFSSTLERQPIRTAYSICRTKLLEIRGLGMFSLFRRKYKCYGGGHGRDKCKQVSSNERNSLASKPKKTNVVVNATIHTVIRRRLIVLLSLAGLLLLSCQKNAAGGDFSIPGGAGCNKKSLRIPSISYWAAYSPWIGAQNDKRKKKQYHPSVELVFVYIVWEEVIIIIPYQKWSLCVYQQYMELFPSYASQ